MRRAVAFAFMDGRIANESKQRVRVILAHRLQSFFITLRARFPEDADAILKRVEQQATPRPTMIVPGDYTV